MLCIELLEFIVINHEKQARKDIVDMLMTLYDLQTDIAVEAGDESFQ